LALKGKGVAENVARPPIRATERLGKFFTRAAVRIQVFSANSKGNLGANPFFGR
jgi:hypothetical protein